MPRRTRVVDCVRYTSRRTREDQTRVFESRNNVVIDFENRRTRLIYMRSEPQDTSEAVQVQYERMSIIDMDVEWRWRVGAVRVDRDGRAWW